MATPRKTAAKKTPSRASGVSSVADFKAKQGGLMTLPSGLVMKLKNPGGLRVFLENGSVPNALMGIAQEALDKGKPANMKGVIDSGQLDEEAINGMLEMMDKVMITCAVEPKVHPVPTDDDLLVWNKGRAKSSQTDDPQDLKSDDLLYVDEIAEEDKMFVFQWVTGGVTDVAQFREGLTAELATLQ